MSNGYAHLGEALSGQNWVSVYRYMLNLQSLLPKTPLKWMEFCAAEAGLPAMGEEFWKGSAWGPWVFPGRAEAHRQSQKCFTVGMETHSTESLEAKQVSFEKGLSTVAQTGHDFRHCL